MQKKTWCRWVTINLTVKNQIYFSCLVCLSWRWHAWCARSHGNSTWFTVCHRAQGRLSGCSLSQPSVKASFSRMFAYWELLDSCSEKLMRYVFELLVDGSHQYCTIFWSCGSIQWEPHRWLLLYKAKWILISLDRAVLHWAKALTFHWN